MVPGNDKGIMNAASSSADSALAGGGRRPAFMLTPPGRSRGVLSLVFMTQAGAVCAMAV